MNVRPSSTGWPMLCCVTERCPAACALQLFEYSEESKEEDAGPGEDKGLLQSITDFLGIKTAEKKKD